MAVKLKHILTKDQMTRLLNGESVEATIASNKFDGEPLIDLEISYGESRDTRDLFWLIVCDCLVEFHKVQRAVANEKSSELRAKLESELYRADADFFYHEEPFEVACNIANNPLLVSQLQNEYEQILEKRGW